MNFFAFITLFHLSAFIHPPSSITYHITTIISWLLNYWDVHTDRQARDICRGVFVPSILLTFLVSNIKFLNQSKNIEMEDWKKILVRVECMHYVSPNAGATFNTVTSPIFCIYFSPKKTFLCKGQTLFFTPNFVWGDIIKLGSNNVETKKWGFNFVAVRDIDIIFGSIPVSWRSAKRFGPKTLSTLVALIL